MSNTLYEAHPSVLRMRPFGVLFALVLIAGGILVAVLGDQLLPPQFTGQVDGRILQMIGIGVFALATLQLLGWWVSARADRLVITEDELIWTHGLLSKEYTEINMASVRTVRVSQSLFQRIMNAGDVTVFTAGDNPELFVRGLPDPTAVRELVKAQPQAGG
ncbi:PH domain-containing protein [Thiorhodococcus minor]|uniref:PH domain-containing protein n=1 Tax=Thiorhodococcus minor TaxID=57489 RepID=A0A6M0JSD8_9GAMM|nr:PH domain-containing protein [Thiorhodococcus minor]NEV60432.1 PH domain-containing protein [Thiorhodococcus minor]